MTEISGDARHAAIDALIEAGFVDPDDGTDPRWRDNEPVPVWTVPAQVVDVVMAAALPHLRAHQAASENLNRPLPVQVDRDALAAQLLARFFVTEDAAIGNGSEVPEWSSLRPSERADWRDHADAVLALLPTEAETKALAETATKLGYELGRKEALREVIDRLTADGEINLGAVQRALRGQGETSTESADPLDQQPCPSVHPMASHIHCTKPAGHEGDHVSRNGRNWRPRELGGTP